MPLRIASLFAVALVALLSACSENPPRMDTGVDLTTPVVELAGWGELTGGLGLPAARIESLARWVEVFREGLDISRRASDPLTSEREWWAESETSLESVVGAENVAAVLRWLETTFGRRGGAA